MSEPIHFDASTATQLSERMTNYFIEMGQHMNSTVAGFLDCQDDWNDAKSNLFVGQLNIVISDVNKAISIFREYADKLMTKINELRS